MGDYCFWKKNTITLKSDIKFKRQEVNNVIIRQEVPEDYNAVYELVKQAFSTTTYSDGTEQDYLNGIRNKDCFIPELSLVAVEKGTVVGQIVLYKMQITCNEAPITQLVVSPLSVLPACFGQGVGMALLLAGCEKAKSLGYKVAFLCGDYAYYSKAGFVPTYQYGIYHVNDTDKCAQWCMVKELVPGCLRQITGIVDIE